MARSCASVSVPDSVEVGERPAMCAPAATVASPCPCGRLTRIGSICRLRFEADDLVSAQRLEEWLKAAADEAAQHSTVDFDVADSRRPLQLAERRGADETDCNPLWW